METIDPLTSSCSTLGLKEFNYRYDRVPKCLHKEIYQHYNLLKAEKFSEYKLQTVLECEDVIVIRDIDINTIYAIQSNWLDIIIAAMEN